MHSRMILLVALISLKATSCSAACTKYLSATTSYKYQSKPSTSDNGFCTWFINPSYSTGYYLEIYWLTFSVAGMMPDCDQDYVEVFTTSSYRSLGKYCTTNMGGSKPTYMFSVDGRMKIQYNSHNNSNLYLRYRLRSVYSSLGSSSYASCYKTNNINRAGYIYSSGYPRGYKGSTSSCYHKITAGANKETRIVFMDLNLNYSTCGYDDYIYVKGSDSSTATYSTSSVVAGPRCYLKNMIVTRKKYIFIRFRRRRGSTSRSGFVIGYMVYDVQPKTIPAGTCTFAVDNCGFIQDTTDKFDWTRATSSTTSQDTGPSVDHTYGTSANGKYLYIEASSPRKANDTARISKQYTGMAAGGSCLSFWYHMYGSNIGTLNVYSKATMLGSLGTARWTMVGAQGDQWRKGEFTLLGNSAVVVFEGVIGNGFRGDIAIDDVAVNKAAPCSNADVCNFEKGLCGFIRDSTGNFNWSLDKGGTSSSSTGPAVDHTFGTSAGYYMYIEASSPRILGQKARISKQYTGLMTGGSCLSFWYHMYGSQIGTLNVYVKDSTASAIGIAKWSVTGQQGNVWKNASITIYGNSLTVVFEGVIGSGFRGDIAIDDVAVNKAAPCSNAGGAPFIVQHYYSKLCMAHNTANNNVYLTKSCNEHFIVTSSGTIQHVKSRKCPIPEKSTHDNSFILLQPNCDSPNAKYIQTGSKSLQQVTTGKCIHPLNGGYIPAVGTPVVIYAGCDVLRLRFDIIYVTTTTAPPATTTTKITLPTTATTPQEATTPPSRPNPTTTSPATTVPVTTTTAPQATTTKITLPTTATTPQEATTPPSRANPTTVPTKSGTKAPPIGNSGSSQQKNPVSEGLLKTIVIVVGLVVGLAFILITACFVHRSRRRRQNERNSRIAMTQEKSNNLYVRDPTFNSSDTSSKVIENAASINSRPLPERPLGEASHLPQMQFSDRRNQSLHGAPFTIEDGMRGVMKKQSMVIANTHSSLNLDCSLKAVKQVCSRPSLSDSADCADVGVANASITNEDYIEMKQADVATASNIYEEIKPSVIESIINETAQNNRRKGRSVSVDVVAPGPAIVETKPRSLAVDETTRNNRRKGRSMSVDVVAPAPAIVKTKPRSLTVDESISGENGDKSPFLDRVRRSPKLDHRPLPPAIASHEKPNISQRRVSAPFLPSSLPSTLGMTKNRKLSAPNIMATSSPFQPHLEEIEEHYLAPSQILTPQVHMSQLTGNQDSSSKAQVSDHPDMNTDETTPELPPEDYFPTPKPVPNIQDKTEKGLSRPDFPANISLALAGAGAQPGARDGNEAGMISNKPPQHTEGYLALWDVKNSAIGSMAAENLPTNSTGQLAEHVQTDGIVFSGTEITGTVSDSQV